MLQALNRMAGATLFGDSWYSWWGQNIIKDIFGMHFQLVTLPGGPVWMSPCKSPQEIEQ